VHGGRCETSEKDGDQDHRRRRRRCITVLRHWFFKDDVSRKSCLSLGAFVFLSWLWRMGLWEEDDYWVCMCVLYIEAIR
jgi:hypothetical protein